MGKWDLLAATYARKSISQISCIPVIPERLLSAMLEIDRICSVNEPRTQISEIISVAQNPHNPLRDFFTICNPDDYQAHLSNARILRKAARVVLDKISNHWQR